MVDTYTKVILTVIAVALVALAARPLLAEPAIAQMACGAAPSNACYVTQANGGIFNVRVVR